MSPALPSPAALKASARTLLHTLARLSCLALPMATASVAFAVRAAEPPPAWAYPVNPPGFKPAPDDGTPRRVPGSTATYTLSQVRDRFVAPDWHPGDHPPMPEVVARGRKPGVFACGYCHRADGPGGPENSSLAGLPEAYILRQMADFKSGARRSAVPQRAPVQLKASMAKEVSEAELAEAARYFAALKPRAHLQVIETEQVPRTAVAGWVHVDLRSGETEALAGRIVEVPEDAEHFESRDARTRFIAYAPVGSVKRGAALAAGSGVPACASCHGAGLRGQGDVPSIAGRSPSYVMRQLVDMKLGTRAGTGVAPMKPVADALSHDQMTALAAYLATLPP
jgi:cytochrome c553